jgi:long-chain acyl-CoA synthetase
VKLGSLIADCALRYPEREVIVCNDRRISFGELDRNANRLANAYAARGMQIGDRLAMFLPNSAELIEAMCGAAKAGGVIVPIATRLAPPEVAYILGDCEPWMVCFTPEHRDVVKQAIKGLDNPLLVVFAGEAEDGEITFDALMDEGDEAQPPHLPTDFDTLMLGYTSGTTGRPKGALATHAALVLTGGYMNLAEWHLTSEDRILATTPMAHRTGLGRVANAVCCGCTVVIMEKFDPVAAVDLIEKEKITLIGLVPTIARMLTPEIEKRPDAVKTARLMVATGEAFPIDIKKRLAASAPNIGLYTFYAQTEAGFITGLRPEEQASHPDSCGRPVPSVDVRIVDEDMNDLPRGEVGEIICRCGVPGTLSMPEYWRNPEATKAAFHEGWLRTGDLARMEEDGYVYFVDRAKDMIVSGGLNIYSREVEDALEAHPAINEAAVLPVPDAEFGESVFAYVTFQPGQTASEADLIEHCRTMIASYKKPKHVHEIDVLPRNSTGKVVKVALRDRAAKELAIS